MTLDVMAWLPPALLCESFELRYTWDIMLSELRKALNSRTGKNTQWVILGESITAIFGFLINVILLRKMTTEAYGLFSLFFSLMMLLGGFIHLGWAETYVRFGSLHRGKSEFLAIRSFSFRQTLLGLAGCSLVVFFFSPWIAHILLKRDFFTPYILLATLGACLMALFTFVQNDHRIHENIRGYLFGRMGSSVLRLMVGAIAVIVHGVTLPVVAILYVASPLIFILKPLQVFYKKMPQTSVALELKSQLTGYNSWLFVSIFATTVIGNVDAQVLAHYHDNMTLSAFSAAGRLTLPIQILVASMTTTLLPRLSAVKEVSEMRRYLKTVISLIVPLGILILASCWFVPPVLIWIAGKSYSGITSLLQLQILMILIMLLTNPIGLVLNGWGWSRLLAILNVGQLIVDLVLDFLWIPRWGATGAVLATLVVNLMGMVTIYSAVWYGLRQKDRLAKST